MFCVRRRLTRAASVILTIGVSLASRPAAAAPDGGVSEPSGTTKHGPATLRLDAAAGIGWARDASDTRSRGTTEARGELSYVGVPGAVFALHGVYQSSERTFLLRAPVNLATGGKRVVDREQRVIAGA